MINSLVLALQISALGMGLVFIAIILLWLMMSALTAIPSGETEYAPEKTVELPVLPDVNIELMTQAAAVAVAVALAEQSQSTARPLPQPPTNLVSAWQLGMRTRQMYEKGGR